jgi:hypothetical protein
MPSLQVLNTAKVTGDSDAFTKLGAAILVLIETETNNIIVLGCNKLEWLTN